MCQERKFIAEYHDNKHYRTFKMEVFNAFQMRFDPSKYTSFKTILQNVAPN
jgi:hypothetical protein